MNSFETDIIKAYTAVCRGYQLQEQPVLQAFAKALSVMGFLASGKGTEAYYASQIFTGFIKSYSPYFQLNKEKRTRGIRHLRAIISINKSCRSEADKERAYEQISNHWFNVNAIQGEGSILYLHKGLSITLPKGILLLCDLFRCRVKDALHYFIEEVVLQMEDSATTGAAQQFLINCVVQLYDVKNN